MTDRMLKGFLLQITTHWRVLLIFLIWLALVLTNFTAGTTLSGWDNLHPEFNLKANIIRSLSASWQEYQSFGLVGGMGHAADLVRQLALIPTSFFLGEEVARYLWVFTMLMIGAIGGYVLLETFLPRNTAGKNAALLGSLFYLLNLATVQNFYVVFEPYYWYFGMLPWVIFAAKTYFEKPTRKNIMCFAVLSWLASPIGYLQTAFLTLSVVVGIFSMSWFFAELKKPIFSGLKKTILLPFLLIVVNLFWLFPVIFFTFTTVQTTVTAKMNQIATVEVSESNATFGTWENIITLKGYWLQLHDYQQRDHSFSLLLEPWVTHLNLSHVSILVYALALLTILGFLYSWKVQPVVGISYLVIVLFLLNPNQPLGFIGAELKETIPLLEQIFRSPFTKWAVPLSFISSLQLGFGSYLILSLLQKKLRMVSIIIFAVIGISIIGYSWPTFRGNFLYKNIRVEVPSTYFSLFSYLNNQNKEARILVLPVHSFWGWNFYDWGYRGSGFLWYGIEQPIIDRAFDVWSLSSETFYQQFAQALYNRDQESVLSLLNRYDITYVLIDTSVITTDKHRDSLFFEESLAILKQIGGEVVWQEGNLVLVKNPTSSPNFITSVSPLVRTSFSNHNKVIIPQLLEKQSFIEGNDLHFPFAHLTEEIVTTISYQPEKISLTGTPAPTSGKITLPDVTNFNTYPTVAQFSYQANGQLTIQFPFKARLHADNSYLDLPTLPSQSLPVQANATTLLVEMNDVQVKVASNATVLAPVNLVPFEAIDVITVDDKDIVNASNSEITVVDELVGNVIPASIWNEFAQPRELIVSHPQHISLEITNPAFPIVLAKNSINCDVLKRGTVKATYLPNQVQFQANLFGSNCAGMEVIELGIKNTYFLRFRGNNISGRPLKFFVNNAENQRVVLENLLSGQTFDKTYSLFSSSGQTNASYTLTLENKSFGLPAENELQQIEGYVMPIEYLANINVTNNLTPPTSAELQISEKYKIGTFLYGLKTQGEGFFKLSQAYDSQWLALAHKPNDPFYQLTLLPHYQYNGWANAWEVPPGEHKIVVIYWPQLLSFAGYGLLLGTFGYFAWMGWRSRSVRQVSAPTTTLPE